jgi:ribA/ribD-fused uncharacterized protein
MAEQGRIDRAAVDETSAAHPPPDRGVCGAARAGPHHRRPAERRQETRPLNPISATAAGPIERFSGPYAFLSSFHPSRVTLGGHDYPTVEHAFQAANTDDPDEREPIRRAPSAGQAKRLRRQATLRPGWEHERVPVMRGLVLQKFSRHPQLAERLLATRGRELVERNDWGDRFWGVCGSGGENRLGQILMEVRAYLAGRRDAGEGA